MTVLLHTTPCHASPHGSPPLATQPGIAGSPSETYRLFIAATDSTENNADINVLPNWQKHKIRKEHKLQSDRHFFFIIFLRGWDTHWAPSPNLNVPTVMMCYDTKKLYQRLITSNKTIALQTRWLSPENSKQNDISKRAFFAGPYTINDCYPGKQKNRLSWTKLMYFAKF